MIPKPILLVGITVLISLLAVLTLYIGADRQRNYQYASFERNFAKTAIRPEDTINLKYLGYYFAGHTEQTLYLGNTEAVGHLLKVDKSLNDTAHYQLRVNIDSLKYSAIHLTVDSPHFYLADGIQGFIYRGGLSNKTARPYINNVSFKTAIPVSHSSFALVVISNMENTLAKSTVQQPNPVLFPEILEEQGEGIFSTDGLLTFDHAASQLIYVYYYRNQYICVDTSLNILYRGNTIDSISRAKIKINKIQSENTYTMSAPPLTTNKRITASGGLLFIQSGLLSKNEKVSNFEKASVIDVYNTATRAYTFSFYLPQSANSGKAKNFLIIQNELFALYGAHLVKYQLTLNSNSM